MSSGPTLTGKEKFESTIYYHLKLEKKDWCIYFKKCPIDNNVPGNYCWICKYHKKLDVPHLLAERGRD